MTLRALTIFIMLFIVSLQPCLAKENETMNNDSIESIQWKRLVVDVAAGAAINFGVTAIIKNSVHEMRPNREDNHSFPSRHATLAWSWGSRIAYRFSERNRWWTPAIHIGASAISQQRIMARKHYAGDVMVGTAMGLGSAWASDWISTLIFGKRELYPPRLGLKAANGPSFMVSTKALLAIGWNGTNDPRSVRHSMSGYGTYITANFPINDNWSVIATTGISSYQLSESSTHAYICPINALDFLAGASVSTVVGPKPVECYGSFSVGIRHFMCDIPTNKNTLVTNLNGGFNVFFLSKLAIGPGISLDSYRFSPFDHKANNLGAIELSFTLNSRIYF